MIYDDIYERIFMRGNEECNCNNILIEADEFLLQE
jgi:hypothetical protein